MISRYSKILLVAFAGLFAILVGVDNIIDYNSNFQFVRHVLSMDTTFPNNALMWRAITADWMHHAAYWIIIVTELATGILCLWGSLKLYRLRHAPARDFNATKDIAILGLVVGITLYFFGFLVVGGEWFQMWQSPTWNGQQAAFRIVACLGIFLLFVSRDDPEMS